MFRSALRLLLLAALLPAVRAAEPYTPAWADAKPRRTIPLTTPSAGTDEARGDALVKAVAALQPGDRLVLPAGRYSVARFWDITVSGTEQAPIWITAADGAAAVITRPDARQNVMNVGQGAPVAWLCLRGLEITGGSHGLRLGKCRDVMVDRCHIHHTGEVCLSANSADTARLFLTRNHVHHGSGHAEGFYLGGNDGSVVMSESVVALNHVHDCYGDQGDGIEVKQGSWGNLIAENDVHDTNYPCITVYGTAGRPRNIIERNRCRNSRDNVMQVQGEAIVRNNLLVNGGGSGFSSTDHQGRTRDLTVVHNTIVNIGPAFRGGSWNDRPGMILANNVICSRDAAALHFPNGSTGVVIAGNVVTGGKPPAGCTAGRGLADFRGLAWDGSRTDATPVADGPFDHADAAHLLPTDLAGKPRGSRRTAGAFAFPTP